jgi:aspartate kinase
MKVYKFGGASVRDAAGVRNVASIIKTSSTPLIVVVSAMGKTTNALEDVVNAYFDGKSEMMATAFDNVKSQHQGIANDLFGLQHPFHQVLESLFEDLSDRLEKAPSLNYDYEYDQIVSYGELVSTLIVSHYLNHEGIRNEWTDIRPLIKTDEVYRDAGINWELTSRYVKAHFHFSDTPVYITQGFIGSTNNNLTTTLGREGSDYTAAILGHIMDAEHVAIWKDVPGVLTADPRWYPRTTKLREISYWEAIELTYFGAQVIHPKTLKPLQNKKIPLLVKSFIDPTVEGTIIRNVEDEQLLHPVFILKQNQMFITISPRDLSFIMEDNLSDIFACFSKHRIKMNLMQNSALNFSACIDVKRGIDELFKTLADRYVVRFNEDVELLTIRHYTADAIKEMTADKDVIDSQITRKTARFVIKKSPWNFS